MEGEDQGTGAVGEHAERSCEKDEVDISWGREQGLNTQFIFESCKHCHEMYQVEYTSSASQLVMPMSDVILTRSGSGAFTRDPVLADLFDQEVSLSSQMLLVRQGAKMNIQG